MNFDKKFQSAFSQMKAAIASDDPNAANKLIGLLTDAEWCEALILAATQNRYLLVSNLVYDKDVQPFMDTVEKAIQIAKQHKNVPMENALTLAPERFKSLHTPN